MNTLTDKQLDWVQRMTILLVVFMPPFMLQLTNYSAWVVYGQTAVLLTSIAFVSYQLIKQKRIKELKRRLIQIIIMISIVLIAIKLYNHFYVEPKIEHLFAR